MKKHSDFKNKKDFIKYLIQNKRELIDFKKSVMKFADAFGSTELQSKAVKALNTSYKDDIPSGVVKRTVICNTYNWMDSHDDVHIEGVFTKSISERADKIWHLHDHEQKMTGKVGKPISVYEKEVEWSDMGVDKAGKTIALFMDSNIIKEYNPFIFGQYVSKEVNQHSVGMIYRNIDLAINDPEEKEEYSVWNKYIAMLGNREKAEVQGFFWAVTEADLIENSCVLQGSNELTPTVDNKEKEKDVEVKPKSFYELLAHELNG